MRNLVCARRLPLPWPSTGPASGKLGKPRTLWRSGPTLQVNHTEQTWKTVSAFTGWLYAFFIVLNVTPNLTWWFLKPMLHVYSSSLISGVSTYLETTLQTTPSWFATLRSSRSEGLPASSWSRMRSSPDRLSSSRSSRCACPSWRKIRQRRTCLQVICEMPALDIHSNEERHRFDLRDNTDQTRMFIKVKIAPTGSFSR